MAVPSEPTHTTISQESIRLLKGLNAGTINQSELTRCEVGLSLVKGSIMDEGTQWDFLRTLSYQPLTAYQSQYQMPADFGRLIHARLGTGTIVGDVSSGTSNTVTFTASTTASESQMLGKDLIILAGTGANQRRQITAYNSTTRVASVSPNWSTNPDSTSDFLVVDRWKPLSAPVDFDITAVTAPQVQGEASAIFVRPDSAEGDFMLDRTPSAVAVVELYYYADLLKMDTDTSTNPQYGRFLRQMEKVLVYGLFAWLCTDDTRAGLALREFESRLAKAAANHLFPNSVTQVDTRLNY